ncbi:MAG: hypothetical protein Q9226_004398 [Calogaya cf. arnoldii]
MTKPRPGYPSTAQTSKSQYAQQTSQNHEFLRAPDLGNSNPAIANAESYQAAHAAAMTQASMNHGLSSSTGGKATYIGSKTETALLTMAKDFHSYEQPRTWSSPLTFDGHPTGYRKLAAFMDSSEHDFPRETANDTEPGAPHTTRLAHAWDRDASKRSQPLERRSRSRQESKSSDVMTSYMKVHVISMSWSPGIHPQRILSKIKRGLPGFVNGARVSALPDTGSSRNVVSLAFAQDMKLGIHGSPADFMLGNSTYTKSIGTVTLDWAFSDNPRDVSKIICDVLPGCNYSMILGSRFLTATQTLSKFRSRLTECLFSTLNVLKMNLLGNDNTRLHGYVGGGYGKELIEVAATPDTGAEGNIMDRNFAARHGLSIRQGQRHRNLLQFADGTYQETIGQVQTHWTFQSGERVPLTFEVLENCCSDVVLGDTILYNYNVFEDHAASISSHESQHDIQQLAPFDFVKSWQRTENPSAQQIDILEVERREAWDCQFSFGETATEAEKVAEKARRDLHNLATSSASPGAQPQHPRTISVPSIATAPNPIRQPSFRTGSHPQHEGYR